MATPATDKLNILVFNNLSERQKEMIKGVAPEITVTTCDLEDASRFISDTDILALWGWQDIRHLFPQASRLKWVHTLSAGVEQLIFPALQESAVILTNSKGIHGIPVSEHVLALMLCFTRGLNLLIRQQAEKVWQRVPTDELNEKTVGIIGLGSIGREIAKKVKALNMRTIAIRRTITDELFVDLLLPPEKLDRLLQQCDFVVIALPLTPETRGLIGTRELQLMKKDAYLINIARGEIVKEGDLVQALKEGWIKGAGLDVFEHEPLPPDSELYRLPNVIVTPHLAALSPYYLDRAVKLFADNLARFVNGRDMLNVIDKRKGY